MTKLWELATRRPQNKYWHPIKHLRGKEFIAALKAIDVTLVCDADEDSCGEEKQAWMFGHRPRKRESGYESVDVDRRCKVCQNIRRNRKNRERDVNGSSEITNPGRTQNEGNWKKSELRHTGPIPGTPEHRFFCR